MSGHRPWRSLRGSATGADAAALAEGMLRAVDMVYEKMQAAPGHRWVALGELDLATGMSAGRVLLALDWLRDAGWVRKVEMKPPRVKGGPPERVAWELVRPSEKEGNSGDDVG